MIFAAGIVAGIGEFSMHCIASTVVHKYWLLLSFYRE